MVANFDDGQSMEYEDGTNEAMMETRKNGEFF